MEAIAELKKDKTVASWIPTRKDETFTSDDLIDAYLHGRKDAFAAAKRLAFDKLNTNIEKSKDITVSLLNTLKRHNFNPVDAYLMVDGFDYFKILITVPELERANEDFLEMYDLVAELEEKNKNEFYYVLVSFCHINEYFDEEKVLSDGYILKLSNNV
ncbi:MAG: hypothetical protein LBE91_03960 [Tannerella sp.]|jgi:hypothetical protein|nr:hypothetical protein [Tannerella sp.]